MLLIKSKCTDEYDNNSYWKYQNTNESSGFINTPSISYPINNCHIGLTSPLRLHISALSVKGNISATVDHVEIRVSTDYYGDELIAIQQATALSGTTDQFCINQETLDLLDAYTAYYISVRYVTTTLGNSYWSIPVKVLTIPGINERDCVLYRHESNNGTVVEYLDLNNKWKKFIVCDANYRAIKLKFYNSALFTAAISSKLPYYVYSDKVSIFSGTVNPKSIIPNSYTNYTLKNKLNIFKNDGTAKSNDDAYINLYGSSALPVINHARSKSLIHDKITYKCDIPTMYQLSLIWMLSDILLLVFS